jgi:hypothetical protein
VGDDLEATRGPLHLATAFPRPVWLDHLLPLLELGEVVILRVTCKALRAIVADMRADLGPRPLKHLKAMLTCFPKADTVDLYIDEQDDPMTPEEQDSLMAWLKERGNSLTDVHVPMALPFSRRVWRAGVFKTVKSVYLTLAVEEDRDLIIDGVVSGVESIQVFPSCEAPQVERAALGYLRTFSALKEIECYIIGTETLDIPGLPPFIPPSLRKLKLDCEVCSQPVMLLGCLPPMIESSGAKLRCLQLTLKNLDDEDTACGVRSLLQACASTLTEVTLHVESPFESAPEVAGGLASCTHLERLTAPISIFAVMPAGSGITFRLVHLELSSSLSEGRALSSLELWGLMSRGGFPSLTSLDMGSQDWNGGPAMVAAFKGVAGTLKTLKLTCDKEIDMGKSMLRQLGEAIGKLRRLETLHLEVGVQGVEFHQIAQGMAVGACPALRSLTFSLRRGGTWLASEPSIILPSVQRLRVYLFADHDGVEAHALACALKIVGYRGHVIMHHVPIEEGGAAGARAEIRRLLTPLSSGVGFV